jgi:GntR family transcriptional repressor for pyruvate dehydrogenase complex
MPKEKETRPADAKTSSDAEGKAKRSFIQVFESLILSGRYKPGDRVPAERDLSKDYRISRPIIHEGLLELANKGFVSIFPRRGTFVNDFRRSGSIDSIASLFAFTEGKLTRRMYESLLEFRLHFELEAARKAAMRRSGEDIEYLKTLLEEEAELVDSAKETESPLHPDSAADLDFRFHLAVALASGNEVYPLFFNSFRKLNIAILRKHYANQSLIAHGFAKHADLVAAIEDNDEDGAGGTMREILMTSPMPTEQLA